MLGTSFGIYNHGLSNFRAALKETEGGFDLVECSGCVWAGVESDFGLNSPDAPLEMATCSSPPQQH